MKERKSAAMHQLFGIGDGFCKGCCHLYDEPNAYKKCEVYGNTGSEATDWAQSWVACGLKNKPYNGDRAIIEILKHEKRQKAESQVDGQLSLDL